MSGTSNIPGAASPLPTIGGCTWRPLPGGLVPRLDREFKEYTVARLEDLANNKAGLVSPAFTGTPTAPTPASGDSSAKVATTAFVMGEVGSKADLVGGKVPSSQLPSYMDDVLEYARLADFPATGEEGKIYVAKDTNRCYRWSGSRYTQVGGADMPAPVAPSTNPEDEGRAADAYATGTALAARPTKAQMEAGWLGSEWTLVSSAPLAGFSVVYERENGRWAFSASSVNTCYTVAPEDALRLVFVDEYSETWIVERHRYAGPTPTKPDDIGAQPLLTFDNAPTSGSNNPVKSGGIWSALWGALAETPTGFSSLYDWCVSQFAEKQNRFAGSDAWEVTRDSLHTINIFPWYADYSTGTIVWAGFSVAVGSAASTISACFLEYSGTPAEGTWTFTYGAYASGNFVVQEQGETTGTFSDTELTFNDEVTWSFTRNKKADSVAHKEVVDKVLSCITGLDKTKLDKSGGTVTGTLALEGNDVELRVGNGGVDDQHARLFRGELQVSDGAVSNTKLAQYLYDKIQVTANGSTYTLTLPLATGTIALLSDIYAAVQQIAPDFTAKSYTPDELCTYNGVVYRCRSGYTATASSEKPSSDTTHWEAKKVSELFLPLIGGTMTGDLDISKRLGTSHVRVKSGTRYVGIRCDSTSKVIETEDYDFELPDNDGTLALAAPSVASAGNLAALDASGNPTDSGVKPSDKLDSTSAAPAFSTDLSVSYPVGSHCTHNGKLYKCTTATTGGTWVAASWTADTMTDPDAVLDITAQNQLRVMAKDGTLLWAQGYDLASTSSATLACDATNNFTFADGATTQQAFTLPTAPTGKVGDFGLDIDNSANTSAATMTLTGLDTTFSVVVPEGESLTDMLSIAAGELARFYVTLTTFRVNSLPTWHIVKQVVENGGAPA